MPGSTFRATSATRWSASSRTFPGFADQANFDLKVDETFNKWAGDASKGQLTYTGMVKPWFSGQVAVGLLQMPGAGTEHPDLPRVVVGFGVKDRAKLDTTIGTVETLAGGATSATFSDEDYKGTTLTTVTMGSWHGRLRGHGHRLPDRHPGIRPEAVDRLPRHARRLTGEGPGLQQGGRAAAGRPAAARCTSVRQPLRA